MYRPSPIRRLADGGAVSPYSIRGIASTVGNTYDAARDATATGFERLHATFGRPAGYTPAMSAPAPAPAAPAPVATMPQAAPAATVGGAIGAIRQHQQDLANLKNGGPVRAMTRSMGGVIQGPGTGTSDSIPTAMDPGSYVVPADTTQQVKQPVNVSNGETALAPEQVHAVGQAALEALRGVTHKQVKMPRRHGKANGGAITALSSLSAPLSRDPTRFVGVTGQLKHMADGGAVGDQPNTVRTVLQPSQGSPAASQIPGYSGPVPAADGSHDGPSGTAGQVLDTIQSVAPALGPQGAAIGRFASGVANAGRVVSGLAAASRMAPLVPVLAGAEALHVAASPAAAPSAPTMPAPAAPNPTDSRLAADTQTAPDDQGAQGAPADAPPAAAGIPGVQRFVDPQGRVLYTDGSGAPMDHSQPNAQNSDAADNLAARSQAQGQVGMGPSAAANLPAGYGVTTPADTGGYGILDKGYQQARTAQMDMADAAQLAAKTGHAGATVMSQSIAGQTGQSEEAMRQGGAAQRTATTEAGATQRERENNAAQLQREGPTKALTNLELANRVRSHLQLMKAQQDYENARTSGDPKAMAAAEDTLRAVQGHWERTFPELYSTTAIPAQMNPDGSRTSPGAIVTDKRTGQVRIVGANEWGAGQQPQAMPTDKTKMVAGQTYQTARGPARWDGNQFVQ